MELIKYIKGIFSGVWSCMVGMKVTVSYLLRPWKIVTQQYPENRKKLEMFERFKGELSMFHNDNNQHKCTGCGICAINCPNGTLEVTTITETTDDGKKKRTLDKYIYKMGMCTFCALCVKTCPSQAISFQNGFEHSVFNRDKLIKKLNREGSSLLKE